MAKWGTYILDAHLLLQSVWKEINFNRIIYYVQIRKEVNFKRNNILWYLKTTTSHTLESDHHGLFYQSMTFCRNQSMDLGHKYLETDSSSLLYDDSLIVLTTGLEDWPKDDTILAARGPHHQTAWSTRDSKVWCNTCKYHVLSVDTCMVAMIWQSESKSICEGSMTLTGADNTLVKMKLLYIITKAHRSTSLM